MVEETKCSWTLSSRLLEKILKKKIPKFLNEKTRWKERFDLLKLKRKIRHQGKTFWAKAADVWLKVADVVLNWSVNTRSEFQFLIIFDPLY